MGLSGIGQDILENSDELVAFPMHAQGLKGR